MKGNRFGSAPQIYNSNHVSTEFNQVLQTEGNTRADIKSNTHLSHKLENVEKVPNPQIELHLNIVSDPQNSSNFSSILSNLPPVPQARPRSELSTTLISFPSTRGNNDRDNEVVTPVLTNSKLFGRISTAKELVCVSTNMYPYWL